MRLFPSVDAQGIPPLESSPVLGLLRNWEPGTHVALVSRPLGTFGLKGFSFVFSQGPREASLADVLVYREVMIHWWLACSNND